MALHSSRDFGNVTLSCTFECKCRNLRVCVWNICGVIPTANDRSRLTRRKTCPSPTVPSTTPTGLNPGLFREMPAPYLYKCVPVPVTATEMSAASNNIRTSLCSWPNNFKANLLCRPWEANSGSASESICPLLRNPKAYQHIHNSQHLHHILRQTNPTQHLRLHFIPRLHI